MPAGNEGAELLRVMDELCAELGGDGRAMATDEPPYGLHGRREDFPPLLDAAEESLIETMMRGLAGVAAAAGAASAKAATRTAVARALAGVELVIRGELMMDTPERLSALMPSFVFVVTLPVVEQDRALELSQRAAQLLEELS
jgi:hypothetical protein